MPVGVRRVVVGAVLLLLVTACSPTAPAPADSSASVARPATELRFVATLTQDSRDTARDRIAVVVTNEGADEVTPDAISYLDPRLAAPLVADRLRAIPPGAERRFPLPLADPVCGGPVGSSGRLTVRVGSDEVSVPAGDEVGVVGRWVERRCAEIDVAAVAPLSFTAVRVSPSGETADLVLTATPAGEGNSAYVIESVAGTPVFTSVGDPWAPGVAVSSVGDRVDLPLAARPARCDGHVFGESAGATAFVVGVLLGGERREVLVRMSPEVAGTALDFAIGACRAAQSGGGGERRAAGHRLRCGAVDIRGSAPAVPPTGERAGGHPRRSPPPVRGDGRLPLRGCRLPAQRLTPATLRRGSNLRTPDRAQGIP